MIDGSEKRNRQLAFELQNWHVCEKRSNGYTPKFPKSLSTLKQENLVVDLVSNSAMSSQQFSYRTRVRNLKFPP